MKIIIKILLIFTFHLSLLPSHLQSQWIQQSIPVNKPVSGIEFVDSLRGWACTEWAPQFDTGYVLHTTNGGNDWVIQFQGPYSFNGIEMLNENTGYVCGGDGIGKVFKTTNGGLNWNQMADFGIGGFTDIKFLNNDSGYICANVGIDLWTTTNGGINWTARTGGITQHPSEIFFLNYNTGYCGAQSDIYKTTNAGLNWVLKGNFIQQVSSMWFLNKDTGWIGFTNNKIRYTSNGGDNWITQEPVPSSSGTVTDLFFTDSQRGWSSAIGIAYTLNGGVNWTHNYQPFALINTIWMYDSLSGWAGGGEGIYKTTNGGATSISLTGTGNIPSGYSLNQNYPNPFNPETKIRFSIPQSSEVHLSIYSILGKEIEQFKSSGILTAGEHEFKFISNALPSGTYIYRISVYDARGSLTFSDSKKMLLIK